MILNKWMRDSNKNTIRLKMSKLACVTAASPRKKTEERRLCLTVDNRVRGHVTFPGMCGKWYDWLSHYHANSMSLIGYNFRGFSTGGMRWENLNHFDKSVVWVRAYFAQILSLTTATKISSTEGRVPHSKFELKYWRWTTEYPLTLPTFAGVTSHYWRKEERFWLVLKKWTRSYITL